jgi:hypothetical protein
MLAWPYGKYLFFRNKSKKLLLGYPVIMSSYNFDRSNDAQGPPSDSNGNTDTVVVNA